MQQVQSPLPRDRDRRQSRAVGGLIGLAVLLAGLAWPGLARDAPPGTGVSPRDPEAALRVADEVAAREGLSRFGFSRRLMGTSVTITLYAPDRASANNAANAAFVEMQRLESVMSDYPESFPDSELLQLAKHASADPAQAREVSDDLWPVLVRSVQLHGASDGAFDITAKPFTQLWRISRQRGELPPQDAIDRHRPLVGIEHLHLNRQEQTARLGAEGAWLDLGGIAKGYITDQGLAVIRARGLKIAQVQAGGDMSLGQAPPGLAGWPINVPDFPKDDGGVGLALWHHNGGVSVSGDAFRFVEIGGVRYSHVVDPRTGLGVTGSRYCCVVGPSAFATDPAATIGCILDEQGFEEALEKLGEIEGPLEGWRFQGDSGED
ncbi:MAG: FAD:protein FMN transferase [Planctomycetota bacterium]